MTDIRITRILYMEDSRHQSLPADGDNVETLLNKADRAMYRVKQNGSGGLALCGDLKNAGPY